MKNERRLIPACSKIIIIFVCFFLLVSCSSAPKSFQEVSIHLDPNYNELFSEDETKHKGHRSVADEYVTTASIAFNNADGTQTIYIYASPVFYLENDSLSLIDTRICNTTDTLKKNDGYVYTVANNDIKSYYSKEYNAAKGVIVKKGKFEYEMFSPDSQAFAQYDKRDNFIGIQKNMIIYKNIAAKNSELRYYPTSLGAACEIQIYDDRTKNISLFFKTATPGITVRQEPGGDWIMTDKEKYDPQNPGDVLGVIQAPLLKDTEGKISYKSSMEIVQIEDDTYEIRISLDDSIELKNSVLYISLEARRDKQPDNALYSKLPDLENGYLKNYSVIGNSDDLGIGRLLIRYHFVKPFDLKADEIKQVFYSAYSFGENEAGFELLQVLEDWCSITGNWNDHFKTGNRVSYSKQEDTLLKFDMTEGVKNWCAAPDGQMEHNGVLLKSTEEKEGKSAVILSNDNALYKNRTEIILNEKKDNLP